MNLSIVRQIKTSESTIGEWWLEGKKLDNLYSLEDCDRGLANTDDIVKIRAVKIQNETAIPIGDYRVIVDKSDRWTKKYGYDFYMLHVLDVKGFDGIRVHWGNDQFSTDGCLLVGTDYKVKKPNFIASSRESYARLLKILAPVINFSTSFDSKNKITKIIPKDLTKGEEVRLKVIRNY